MLQFQQVYLLQIWRNVGRGLRISGCWSFRTAPQITRYTISAAESSWTRRLWAGAETPAARSYSGAAHLEPREVTEVTEVIPHHFQHSTDLIRRLALSRTSPLSDTDSKSTKTSPGETTFSRCVCVCVFPHCTHLFWRKFTALISTHRSSARGLLNINYISIFALTTRWLLICDLQTVTGNYWSGPCCHSDDN